MKNRFRKGERVKSKKVIDDLFSGGAKSYSSYPIRVVYKDKMPNSNSMEASILVSVSKRKFKHAVDRNKVKRLIREAYRLNKEPLVTHLQEQSKQLTIAFLYMSNTIQSFSNIEEKIKILLALIIEKDYHDQKDIG